MKNFKLRTKFMFIVVPTVVLIIALSALLMVVSNYVRESTEEALYDELYVASSSLINADRDFYQAYAADFKVYKGGIPEEETKALLEEYEENYQQTVANVAAAAASIEEDNTAYNVLTLRSLAAANGTEVEESEFTDLTFSGLLEGLNAKIQEWYDAFDPVVKRGTFASQEKRFAEAREYLNAMEDFMDQYATYELNNIETTQKRLTTIIYVVVAIVLIAVLAVVVYVVSSILSGIKKVNSNLSELANNNLAFEPYVIEGKDEMAQMSDAVLALKESLQKAIGTVNLNADEIAENIVQVSAGINSSAEGVSNINSAVGEVADTSQQVAVSAQELSERAIEMGNAIESITYSITSLKEASTQIDTINKDATRSMAEVMSSSEMSVSAVHDITEKINETNNAVVRIDECVQMITDISSQTNLLSLNASIEAARAGEAGRGFAVVAEEIRKLADTSAQSAAEIGDIVKSVIEISDSTVASARKVSEVIESEQMSVKDTQEKFTTLSAAVVESLANINAIQEMSMGLEDIKNELADSTSTLSAISEELGASAEEVSATCSQVTQECQSARERSEVMASTKDELQSAVYVFNLG